MLHAVPELLASAALARALLLANHILASEPVATQRLKRHVGRTLRLRLDNWPALLPPPPDLFFALTAAGLLERAPAGDGSATSSDLEVGIDAANPAALVARGLIGRQPSLDVAGDAALAADVSWVIDNVRWDLREDLERVVGEWPAGELARTAKALAGGLRNAAEALLRRTAGSADAASAARPPAR